jgi:hypothetical protein
MLVTDCTLTQLRVNSQYTCLSWSIAVYELLRLSTAVSRTPAQAVAMLADNEGLSPWLDIDRIHVSRHSISLSHCNGSRVSRRYSIALCCSEWLAPPSTSPWWRQTYSLRESEKKTSRTSGAQLHIFIPISHCSLLQAKSTQVTTLECVCRSTRQKYN